MSPSLLPAIPKDTRVPCPKCQTPTKLKICPECQTEVGQPFWRLADDSLIREHAMKIVALRLGGLEDQQIADYLKISKRSLSVYIWRAGKNGWLTDFNSARDAIEFGLAHKVIRNLNEALDDTTRPENGGPMNRTAVALKIAEGTLFKQFGDVDNAPTQQTAISIRIEQPANTQPMRAGTIGGEFLEVETVKGE